MHFLVCLRECMRACIRPKTFSSPFPHSSVGEALAKICGLAALLKFPVAGVDSDQSSDSDDDDDE